MQKIDSKSHPFTSQSADFVLAACVTRTCEIEGITQAGIPGNIPCTPTLDAEFISTGRVYSLPDIAETPKGVPTPALLTRVAQTKVGFSDMTIFDLGLDIVPLHVNLQTFAINPSGDISQGKALDAKAVFEKGQEAGRSYALKGDYLILGESTPSGTTTAYAAVKALGYDADGNFSSSFKAVPDDIKSQTVRSALEHINEHMSDFEKLSYTADNMLLFCAGFVAEASHRFKVMLAGGTQMAAVLLIVDRLAAVNAENIMLCTTKWVYEDQHSDIQALLDQLTFTPQAFYADFDFAQSQYPALKLYDEGEAKEGVGAGAALAYLLAHGVDKQTITQEVEALLL